MAEWHSLFSVGPSNRKRGPGSVGTPEWGHVLLQHFRRGLCTNQLIHVHLHPSIHSSTSQCALNILQLSPYFLNMYVYGLVKRSLDVNNFSLPRILRLRDVENEAFSLSSLETLSYVIGIFSCKT